jgi:hypothetical protein
MKDLTTAVAGSAPADCRTRGVTDRIAKAGTDLTSIQFGGT